MKSYTLAYPATEDLYSIQEWYDAQGASAAGDRILKVIADRCE